MKLALNIIILLFIFLINLLILAVQRIISYLLKKYENNDEE